MNSKSKLEKKILGGLLGLAVGDRIGGPHHMASIIANSLIENQAFKPKDISERYFSWWGNGAFDTGPVFHEVFSQVNKGLDLSEAVLKAHETLNGETAGCNPVHRCLPLALAGFLSNEELESALIEQARLTHFYKLAGEGSALIGMLYRYLVLGYEFEQALEAALQNRDSALRRVAYVTSNESLTTDGYTPHVIAAALYFIRTSRDFDDALTRSLTFAGPANYCPVLVGAIAGIIWGADAINRDFLHQGGTSEEVELLASELIKTWQNYA